MTGLPIIETKAGDVSAYIPTNVISITDGQIYLQADLFNSNVRPAIDVGCLGLPCRWCRADQGDEVGRRPPRLDLAQYRALEAFAMFASDLDRAPGPSSPRAPASSSCSSSARRPVPGRGAGRLDLARHDGQARRRSPVEDIRRFEADFLDHLRRTKGVLLAAIRETGHLRGGDRAAFEGVRSARSSKLFEGTGADGSRRAPRRRTTPRPRPGGRAGADRQAAA